MTYGCEEAFRRLDDWLDRELPAAELELVRLHLEACATCAGEFAFDEAVLRRVRERLAGAAAPAGLLEAIRMRLARGDDV